MAAPAQHSAEPERLYRIGDVSRITDTKPFVLRFWETEFPMLQPVKTPKGHRLYRQQDINLILAIKKLLYREGFTIPGARRHLAEQLSASPAAPALVGADPSALADGSALTKEESALDGASRTAATPPQPALFPLAARDPDAIEPAAASAHHVRALRAVREELRAILTLLGAG